MILYSKGAIIGFSGFIGSNLLKQYKKKIKNLDLFNTKNINEINTKKKYDIVICSALPAAKWKANQKPDLDKKNVIFLVKNIKKLRTKKFILISTIDIHFNHPYGMNRLFLEKFVKKKFKNYYIFRLPGVFGNGLKKNIIFDLIQNNDLHNIFTNDIFQWYDLSLLSKDINKLIKSKKKIFELYSEPIINSEILKFFQKRKIIKKRKIPILYNFKPINGYFYSKKYILKRLKMYIQNPK